MEVGVIGAFATQAMEPLAFQHLIQPVITGAARASGGTATSGK
jgi:hypothetical protein